MTRIIHQNDLPLGGFAGIVETKMVMSPLLWPQASQRTDISHGLGDFLYLSTGYFKPHDGAPLHPHHDVDIVTVVLSGAIGHQGTLGNGTVIEAPGVQVQRAGAGMQHSEFNINDQRADFVQIWFKPPESGLTPDYQNYALNDDELTTVLGGDGNFHNSMVCRVGFLPEGAIVEIAQSFVALVVQGSVTANNLTVNAGDLIEGGSLNLIAHEKSALVLISRQPGAVP